MRKIESIKVYVQSGQRALKLAVSNLLSNTIASTVDAGCDEHPDRLSRPL